jgi:(1->4)-alpha-D-glucan 1-alpha-D-glucosylmutase
VPDIYQGQELWDYSLVDPDNRRPVDFALRRRMLDELRVRRPVPDELLRDWPDGRIKLWVTHQGLCLRRQRPELFEEGSYQGLSVDGAHRTNVVAFKRVRGDERVVVAVPRLVSKLVAGLAEPPIGAAVWADTRVAIPTGRYEDPLTSREVQVGGDGLTAGELFRDLPLALLASV